VTEEIEFRPNPGPQEDFLASEADIAIFGGSAGGGKTFAMLLDVLRWHQDPNFGGIIFRRESVDLIGAGSVWDESQKIYPLFGASSRQNPRDYRFPSGATIEFAHLQLEKDKLSHQGMQYSWIGFEELTHFEESQFWYLVSRRRTKANMRAYVRATCNPDPDSFVAKLVAWWIGEDGYALPERSGVIRYFARDKDTDALVWGDTREEVHAAIRDPDPHRVTSFTFILSRLKDNPKVDPSYRSALLSLPLVERERLIGDEQRGGNWKIRHTSGTMFRRSWFHVLEPGESPPRARFIAGVRGWDKAATENSGSNNPDWTCGGRVDKYESGTTNVYVIEHIERLQGTPATVNDTIMACAAMDGSRVTQCEWEDPGAAGKLDADIFVSMLSRRGYTARTIRASKSKVEYASVWSPLAERGMIYVRRGAWIEAFYAEIEGFPNAKKKDQVDCISNAFVALGDAQPFEWQATPKLTAATERTTAPVTGRFRWKGSGGAL
jgi:predicted phage terminase large subunit-like protein